MTDTNVRIILLSFFIARVKEELMRESEYQQDLKDRIKDLLPGCLVLKNDPNQIQGIPDLLVLYKDKHAFLEVKASKNAKHRPNQDWYVKKYSEDVYSTFIYPENEEEVLSELQRALQPEG